MSIIRADIYRIVRGKGLYITLAVFVFIMILQVVGGMNMNAGVDSSALDMLEFDFSDFDFDDPNPGAFDISELFRAPTGREAVVRAAGGTSNIMYILLPLVVFIGVTDFTSGSAKNVLAGGVSRGSYYFSKLLLSCIVCAALLIVYFVFSTIAATLWSGFGGAFDGEYLLGVAQIFLAQLLLCLAGACAANFFVFLMRSGGFTGVFIAFLLVPAVLILGLSFISRRFEQLFEYELASNMAAAAGISSMTFGEITKMLLVGLCYIVISVAGGYAVFKRAEIK
ncbi:MAG: ABC transporter permease [Oscillospiraceae bacterium]|jgi:ABC-2 type transport system permease protein|nr:ABC transporter permease [Oscillospiraceae bacterium]